MSTRFIRFIPEQVSREYRGCHPYNSPLSELGALNSVNIFVGANNSRKSRLCRHLLSQTQFVTADRACNQTLGSAKPSCHKPQSTPPAGSGSDYELPARHAGPTVETHSPHSCHERHGGQGNRRDTKKQVQRLSRLALRTRLSLSPPNTPTILDVVDR